MQRMQINEEGQAIEVGDGSSYTVFRLDLGWAALIVAAAFLVVVGACGVVMGLNLARLQNLEDAANASTKETRMLEYYVNEVDGKLIHAGFIEPRARWSPEKRKQYEEQP